MSITHHHLLSYFGLALLILLILACGAFPIPGLELTFTATVTKSAIPTNTSTSTATSTLSPAQAALTEFARQAEGTRQVLADTQVALVQNNNATATARALDTTATALAPLPSVDEQVDVQANIIWQDTGIQVRVGNTVKIQYIKGEWTIWSDTDPLTDGMGQYGRDEICRLMPEANLGGLIGRVSENPPFFIGNGTEIYSDYNGPLQLSINDCPGFGDNSGVLIVSVVIER
jgi:hypothetical protein